MKYALVCQRVWEVQASDVLANEILISRSYQAASVARENLIIISTEEEAEKLYRYCEPYVSEMDSFGDIDHLKGIDGNELLPFTESFSSLDNELLDFLNETIRLVDQKIRSH